MRFLVVFALIVVAEMATFFWVGSQIGLGWALGLAVLTALVGSFLVRRAGLSVLSRLQGRLAQGELPGRELTDGAAVLVSGAFLISPGFITDVLGFLLLVPAVRDLVSRVLVRRLSRRITGFGVSGQTLRGTWGDATESSPGLEGDVIDLDGVE